MTTQVIKDLSIKYVIDDMQDAHPWFKCSGEILNISQIIQGLRQVKIS